MLGDENIEKLKNSKVCVFGVGGVGGYVCEALVRSGIGTFLLVDNDTVNLTNINRQIIATTDTVGRLKTDVMKDRILSINPDAHVYTAPVFYEPANADSVDLSGCDYIVDAVDHIPAKVEIALRAKSMNIRCISSMGAGNKLDPTRFEVADIYKTSVCPLARVMRYECKKRGVKRLKVVYSKEPPVRPVKKSDEQTVRRDIPGSTAFVPSVAGLIIAGEVIKDMIG